MVVKDGGQSPDQFTDHSPGNLTPLPRILCFGGKLTEGGKGDRPRGDVNQTPNPILIMAQPAQKLLPVRFTRRSTTPSSARQKEKGKKRGGKRTSRRWTKNNSRRRHASLPFRRSHSLLLSRPRPRPRLPLLPNCCSKPPLPPVHKNRPVLRGKISNDPNCQNGTRPLLRVHGLDAGSSSRFPWARTLLTSVLCLGVSPFLKCSNYG
ncbi:hypothetical protein BDP55DRAFT_32071 [Colletotrichum godetiae]|uniref:Uncharacterized protein n=1 Tax=Colletotrichum godetiae TaxID=1209918 RepID=A0AAJ0EYP1_9PEZI|nr:uncharacterized protein BDP55DRAFT_32071 [Colletotrichum godetiae]KAK1688841.1 hypothetical protein BDP55DRAFT_32071 [Colletotrichum godetiae]